MLVSLLALIITPGHGQEELSELVLRGELAMGFWWTEPLVLPDSLVGESPLWEGLARAARGPSASLGFISDTFQRWDGRLSGSYERDGFFAVAEPFLWMGNDSVYPPRWKGLRSDWARALVGFYTPRFSGYWGRAPVSWGPPLKNHLMFDGGNYPPFDCGELAWQGSWLRVSSFFGVLDPLIEQSIIDTANNLQQRVVQERFINAHRVEVLLLGRLTLSWSEMVLYARGGDGPDLAYFNPIPIYYVYSWTGASGAEDDYLWDLDACLSLPGFLLYGEWLIDDFQYVSDTSWDPNQFALAVGGLKALGRFTLRLDYSMATRWTYNSRLRTTKSLYRNWPFGHPEGSDFQRFLAELSWRAQGLRLAGGASLTRDGAGSIYEKMPYFETDYLPDPSFLAPPVQTDARAWIGLSWQKGVLGLSLTGGYRHISSWQHTGDSELAGPFFWGNTSLSF